MNWRQFLLSFHGRVGRKQYWPAFAVTIKRWHDGDKSGSWVLINFIPVVGDLWSLMENGFLKSTAGDSRFGPDPLAGKT
jgi:uncharacterized membrane protein YhaH (DUF805 family)